MRKLPKTQADVLAEMQKGTELWRVQQYAWGPVKYKLGDRETSAGSVAGLAMAGLIKPIGKLEVGAAAIRYELTESGRIAARGLAA